MPASVESGRWGSSPLARGLPARTGGLPRRRRIIPARAGFTRNDGRSPNFRWDHPRSRGVYDPVACGQIERRGSSPLARGLRASGESACGAQGIIPARAGFTLTISPFSLMAADHPRSRGVYAAPTEKNVSVKGIIPARAGFTRSDVFAGAREQDHPRSRGVYRARMIVLRRFLGSSPLARGLRGERFRAPPRRRIIPARAGFTRNHSSQTYRFRDHPRSRGVYDPTMPSPVFAAGSSPLARGLRGSPSISCA